MRIVLLFTDDFQTTHSFSIFFVHRRTTVQVHALRQCVFTEWHIKTTLANLQSCQCARSSAMLSCTGNGFHRDINYTVKIGSDESLHGRCDRSSTTNKSGWDWRSTNHTGRFHSLLLNLWSHGCSYCCCLFRPCCFTCCHWNFRRDYSTSTCYSQSLENPQFPRFPGHIRLIR